MKAVLPLLFGTASLLLPTLTQAETPEFGKARALGLDLPTPTREEDEEFEEEGTESTAQPIDQNWSGNLTFSNEHPWQSFELNLPFDLAGLDLSLRGEGEADLYLRRGEAMQDWSQSDFQSLGSGASGRIQLDAAHFDHGLGGLWYLDVVSTEPAETTAELEVSFLDAAQLADRRSKNPRKDPSYGVSGDPLQVLEDSAEIPIILDAKRDTAVIALRVDTAVDSIDLELQGAEVEEGTNLDLVAAFNRVPKDATDSQAAATSSGAEEKLTLARGDTPGLRPGLWYVEVVRASGGDVEVPLKVTYHRSDHPAPLHSLPGEEPGVLASLNGPGPFQIDFQPGITARQIAFDVPEDTESLRLTSAAGTNDVDLYLVNKGPVPLEELTSLQPDLDNQVASDISIDGQELLFLDADSEIPLAAGRYYLIVVNADLEFALQDVPLELSFNVPPLEPVALQPGKLQHHLIPRGSQGIAYRVEVPEGVHTLRFAALNASRDVDLFARHGKYVQRTLAEGFDHSQISDRLPEWLTIEAPEGEEIAAGDWFFEAANMLPQDLHTSFDVIVTFDAELPFPKLPTLPIPSHQPLTTLENAMQSLVRIDIPAGQGSGTLVTNKGHILTNWHVVFDQERGELKQDGFLISLPDPAQFDEPPIQLFRARLIGADRARDVALLEINEDIYGRPLPKNYTFPAARIGDPELLHHGDALFVAGYPATGGHESRTSITTTSGIVSGFNTGEDSQRVTIKTDAKINAGNSGGAIFNAAGEYVAAPHSEIIIADDELGFAAPVRAIPKPWQEILRAAGTKLPWPETDEPAEASPLPTAPHPAEAEATPENSNDDDNNRNTQPASVENETERN